jgi:hypothetical protein
VARRGSGTIHPLLTLLAIVVAMLALAAPAHAAFPGANGKIAFQRGTKLLTVNPDGTGLSQIVTTAYNSISSPKWSPDGQRIVFSGDMGDADTGPCTVLVIANADGSGQTEITGCLTEVADYAPSWSPEGSKLAFEHTFHPTLGGPISSDIYTINADGSGLTKLTNNGTSGSRVTNPAWSPDGSKIAFGGSGGVYVMNADGTNQTVLAGGATGYPDWSPDGGRIAFTKGTDLWVMNADGTGQRQLALKTRDPAWSPDGRKFAVLSEFNPTTGIYHLYTMNGDGSGATHIDVQGTPLSPDWQPLPVPEYPHPQSAPQLQTALVPAFRQCGTGGNPANSKHAPSLAVDSCNPPRPGSALAAFGAASWGSAVFTTIAGDDDPTNGNQANFGIGTTLADIQAIAGGDYDPNPAGADLTEVTRVRITDRANGYGGLPATATEYDLRIPLNCAPTADPSLGSTCNVGTSANALFAGFVVEQRQTVVQAFRVRVDDAGNNGVPGDSDDRIFSTQGIFAP